MVVPVHLGFQGCLVSNRPLYRRVLFVIIVSAPMRQSLLCLSMCVQVQREIQVFPAQVAVLVSLAPKEMLVSLVLLVLPATSALLGPQDQHCKAPKDSKDPLVHLEEQVKHLDFVFFKPCTVRTCCLVFG